jgi:hypothetical protein
MSIEADDQEIDLPDGYPAPPVLSLGVAQVVAYPEANWDDRLWDVVVSSDGPQARRITDRIRTFSVRVDSGLPGEHVDQLIREDVDGVPHLYLLAEWNETKRPFILIPNAA